MTGWWKANQVSNTFRRRIRKQRHVERAAAQRFGGAFVGFASGGKDEVLDAEKSWISRILAVSGAA